MENVKNFFCQMGVILAVVFAVIFSLSTSSCSDPNALIDGEMNINGGGGGCTTDTITKDSIVIVRDTIYQIKYQVDAEKLDCNLDSLGQFVKTISDNNLTANINGWMNGKFNVTYQAGNRSADTVENKSFRSNNILKSYGIMNFYVHPDSVNNLVGRKFYWNNGVISFAGTDIPVSTENKTDVVSFANGHRMFEYPNNLCGTEIVNIYGEVSDMAWVNGSTTTSKATVTLTAIFSDGGERQIPLENCLITTSEKDEVIYTIENVVENVNGLVSFEVVEKHTVNPELDVRVPMSFFRFISMTTGDVITQVLENKKITFSPETPSLGEAVFVKTNTESTIRTIINSRVHTYSVVDYKSAFAFEVPVTVQSVDSAFVTYKGSELKITLSPVTSRMISNPEIKTTKEAEYEITDYNAMFSAMIGSQLSNINAVQAIEIKVVRPDEVERWEVTNDYITMENDNYYLNIEGNKYMTVSGKHYFFAKIDLNAEVKINGAIKVMEKFSEVNLKSSLANTVSNIKTDSTSGKRINLTNRYNVNGQERVVEFIIDHIETFQGVALTQRPEQTITFLDTVKKSQKEESIYDLSIYEDSYRTSFDSKSRDTSSTIEERVMNLEPDYANYHVVRAWICNTYTSSDQKNPHPVLAVEFEKDDKTANKLAYYDWAKFSNAYKQDQNLKAAKAASFMKDFDNINTSKSKYVTIKYWVTDVNKIDPADMAPISGVDLMTGKDYQAGWDYVSLVSGLAGGAFTFSRQSVANNQLNAPVLDMATSNGTYLHIGTIGYFR